MWGQHAMAPGFIYSWWGYEDMLGMIETILKHGRAVETLLRWVEGDWVELRQVWGDMRHIMTSQRRSRQISKYLKAICDELASFGTIWDAFETIWDKLRHILNNMRHAMTSHIDQGEFHGVWLHLKRCETLQVEFESNWVILRQGSDDWMGSKCKSSKMYDLLWVRRICCKFGTVSGFAWPLVKSGGPSALHLKSEGERGDNLITNLQILHKPMNWK